MNYIFCISPKAVEVQRKKEVVFDAFPHSPDSVNGVEVKMLF
ncbi:hypothetical protein [Anabaena azotica]